MKIGIVGFGHLGKALVKGLLRNDFVHKEDIFATARSQQTKDQAQSEYGIQVCSTNKELIDKTDIIFICIPSKVFFTDFADCNTVWENKHFVSFMAGVTLSQLQSCLGQSHIMRAMPNLGVEQNNGIICYTQTKNEYIIALLVHLGYSFCVPETEIEKVTAFASCGIGFAAYVLNCFFEVGNDLGFSQDVSAKIVDNIFRNALHAPNYSELVDAVATKGGATEAGVRRFEGHNIKEIIGDAIQAAYRKMA